jgi:nitrate reductase molybdenum cofactor assembly chaperone NarJ/NarW
MSEEPPHPLKLISLLLQYPEGRLVDARADLLEAAAALPDGEQSDAIRRFTDWYAGTALDVLQALYVETFDFTRRAALHLTYHKLGDRRQRGIALLTLKQRYAAAGFAVSDSELPDYLPLILEFAALAPEAGLEILERHRESLELLRAALHDAASPWATLIDAVTMPLPGLSRAQAARVRRLAEQGPPEEQVGLEPFGPPEIVAPGAVPGNAQ